MVNMENYEEYMLLEADGELTDAEQKALYGFIEQHPELKNEMDLISTLKLEPDNSIVYERKEELLKTASGKRTIALGSWWTYGAAAACLAVAILLLRKPDNSEQPNTTAHTMQQPRIDTKTTTGEELHSIPKRPVAIENKQEQPKAIAKARKKAAIHEHKNNAEPIQITEEENIAKVPAEPVTNVTIEPIHEKKNEEYARVPVPEKPAPLQPITDERENRKLFAFAPVQEKFEGFADIREAVSEKVEKVKNIRSRIKDTDIQFRFGNKELTVRL